MRMNVVDIPSSPEMLSCEMNMMKTDGIERNLLTDAYNDDSGTALHFIPVPTTIFFSFFVAKMSDGICENRRNYYNLRSFFSTKLKESNKRITKKWKMKWPRYPISVFNYLLREREHKKKFVFFFVLKNNWPMSQVHGTHWPHVLDSMTICSVPHNNNNV